ncbi:MAG TPA: tyrosine-type recombinase/integrase [Acidimicrobiales bacterium]|nr:tyrosine-type recombinase/integrase [Acidimicrobiales bacterium]
MTAAPLPEPVEGLLSWLATEKGRSANTLAAYRRDLAAYVDFLGQRGLAVADVTGAVVEEYLRFLRASGKAPASVARALVSVRAVHRFMHEQGRAVGNPAGDVGPPPVPPGAPRALPEPDVANLLGAVAGDDAVARRDRAILEVLYASGLRVSELVGLSLHDVDVRRGRLRVAGPGHEERVVPVARPAQRALAAWLAPSARGALVPARWADRADAEAVFLNARGGRLSRQGAWRVVHRHGQRVGLGDRLTPEVLRHSCAAHMLARGADLGVVHKLLGHSAGTAEGGSRVSAEELWRVYEAAHPRAGGSG